MLSRAAGTFAAVVATLNPYLVWHDVHLNREILDQLLAAAAVLLTLIAAERRSLRAYVWLGLVLALALSLPARSKRHTRNHCRQTAPPIIGSTPWRDTQYVNRFSHSPPG